MKNVALKASIAMVLACAFSSNAMAQKFIAPSPIVSNSVKVSPLDNPDAHLDMSSQKKVEGERVDYGYHPDNFSTNSSRKDCFVGFSYHHKESKYAGHYIFPVHSIFLVEISRKQPNFVSITQQRGSEVVQQDFEYPSAESAYEKLVEIVNYMNSCSIDLKLKNHISEKSPSKKKLY